MVVLDSVTAYDRKEQDKSDSNIPDCFHVICSVFEITVQVSLQPNHTINKYDHMR